MAAAAYAGMSEEEMWRSTPAFIMARAHFKTMEARRMYEAARAQSFIVASSANVGLKKGTTIQKMWPLPWERKKAKIIEIDPDELRRISAEMDNEMTPILQEMFKPN